MQEESSSGEAGFEFIDKSAPGSPGDYNYFALHFTCTEYEFEVC